MYSVVLADDEPLIIKGLLKMVDWEQLNAEVVGTAKNGQQLIEQIQKAGAGYYYFGYFHAETIWD